MEYSKFNHCRDIEKNPGPYPVDSSKTIHASYFQGNIEVFGLNAGSQCVAMSFCALLYSSTTYVTHHLQPNLADRGVANTIHNNIAESKEHWNKINQNKCK